MRINIVIYAGLLLIISIYGIAQENNRIRQIKDLLSKGEEMLNADPSKAIYYSNSAIIEAQKIKNTGYITMAQAILGEAYMNQGDFGMGFEVLTNAMATCPPDCLRIQAYIFIHLSGAYMKLKDLDKAFIYVDKATDIYKSLNDSLNLSRCYNLRGLIYIHVPDNVKAEIDFKAALDISRQLNNIKWIAVNLNNLCLCEGNTPEKIRMLTEAISINQSLGKIWSLGENYNNLGIQYYYARDYDKALAALDTAMNYSRQMNAKELISDNYRYKSWVYEARKDYANAYQYFRLLYDTEKELLAINEMRQIELNIVQKQLHDKEQQMVLQEQAFQIKNLRQWIYITILIIVALILVLSYAIYHYRNRKKVQLLEAFGRLESREKELVTLQLKQSEHEAQAVQKELEHNRKELTNLAFFMRSRNDLLAQIQEKIKAGYKLSAPETERCLRSINAYISQFNAQDTDAELLIDEINGQFIQRLSVLHPNLSKNEQRLASLLRVGLTTKEIASIVNATPKTVNMARYRLRKHLNLDTDDSLTEYMKQI